MTIRTAATARDAATALLQAGPRMYTRSDLPAGCLVELGADGTPDAAVRAITRSEHHQRVDQLTDRITHDQDTGLLPPDVDATALAQYTLGTLGTLARMAADNHTTDELAAVAHIALHAWPPPPAAEAQD